MWSYMREPKRKRRLKVSVAVHSLRYPSWCEIVLLQGIGVWVALLSYAATIIYFEQVLIVFGGSRARAFRRGFLPASILR